METLETRSYDASSSDASTKKALKPLPEVTVETIYVTPAMAKEWLEKFNFKNRTMSSTTVTRYVKAMKNGEWQFNGETLIFSDKDKLMNGQHRLQACIISEMSFPTVVIRGVPHEAFLTLDQGKNRSASDILSIEGKQNTSALASGSRVILNYRLLMEGTVKTINMTFSITEISDFVEKNESIEEAMLAVYRYNKGKQPLLRFPSAIALYVFAREAGHPAQKLDWFFEHLISGEDLAGGHPVLTLRNRLLELKTRRSEPNMVEGLVMAIRTFNSYIKGEKINRIMGIVGRPKKKGSADDAAKDKMFVEAEKRGIIYPRIIAAKIESSEVRT